MNHLSRDIFFIYPEDQPNLKLNRDHGYICYGFTDNEKDHSTDSRGRALMEAALRTCECGESHTVDYNKARYNQINTGFNNEQESYYIMLSRVVDAFFVSSKYAIVNIDRHALITAAMIVGTVAAVCFCTYCAKDSYNKIAQWKEAFGKNLDASTNNLNIEALTESRLLQITHLLKRKAIIMNACAVVFALLGAIFSRTYVSQSKLERTYRELLRNYRDRYVSYFNEHNPKAYYKVLEIMTEAKISYYKRQRQESPYAIDRSTGLTVLKNDWTVYD